MWVAFAYSHFFSKKFQHICVSLDANYNESLTNDIVSFEQLGPGFRLTRGLITLVNQVDNYLKEILAFVYDGSIVKKNRPKMDSAFFVFERVYCWLQTQVAVTRQN